MINAILMIVNYILLRKNTVFGVTIWAQRLTGTDPCISFAFGHD